MTESDLRRVCLLAAFERPMTPPWREADALWASDEARRRCGSQASLDRWAAARAECGLTRLAERSPGLGAWLARATPMRLGLRGLGAAVALAGLFAGATLGSIGRLDRFDLLAPPLVGLLAWNLAVYAGLLTWGVGLVLRRSVSRTEGASAARGDAGFAAALVRMIHRLKRAWRDPLGRSAGDSSALGLEAEPAAALARFHGQWARWCMPLWKQRLTLALHLAAAAVALGALGALYLRGLAFELRAVWDSTFLVPQQALTVLGWVLGPASALSGLTLPSVDAFASLRSSVGSGENAARWIHLWAVTLAIFVVLPRLLLASVAGLQAHRLARSMPIAWLDEPALAALATQHGRGDVRVRLLPYRIEPGDQARQALREQLTAALGRAPTLDWMAAAAEGDEEVCAARAASHPKAASSASDGPSTPLAWMSAAQTPERETHGRLILALTAASRATGAARRFIVDETGFGSRLTAHDARLRRAERRQAWAALAEEIGHQAVFVDLSEPTEPALADARRAALVRAFAPPDTAD